MSVSMQDIAKKMNARATINYPEHSVIENICLMEEIPESFESDTVYIVSADAIDEIIGRKTFVNIICPDCRNGFPDLLSFSDLNILFAADFHGLDSVLERIKEIIDEDFVASASLRLYEALASNKGAQHILDTALTLLKNPVLVADTSFKILAHSEIMDDTDELWTKIVEDGYYPKEYVNNVLNDNISENVFGPGKPSILTDSLYGKRFICKKIEVFKKAAGFATTLEHNSRFKDRDAQVFEILCRVLSCELSKISYMSNTRGLMYEYFITELIDNRYVNKELMEKRLEYIDMKLKENLFVLAVRMVDGNTFNTMHLDYLQNELEGIVPKGKSVVYDDSLVMIISSTKNAAFDDGVLPGLLEFLKVHGLVAGVSPGFPNILDLREHYEQACAAITIGIYLDKGKYIYEYTSYSFYHLLDIVSQYRNPRSFCYNKLMDIVAYDRKYKTNYSLTLYIFLECNQNPVTAAHKLSIHRNTIDYRINKISDLFEIMLNDSNVVFYLKLSYKILFYIGELEYNCQ